VPRKRGLPVRVTLRPLRRAQNRLRPTPAIARGKVTSRSTPSAPSGRSEASAPSGRSEASADHSDYGSPHGHGRR